MNILNESALRDMMLQIVKETRPSLEEDLTGRTIGINEFRRKYCGGKSPEWVRAVIFDRFPEIDVRQRWLGGQPAPGGRKPGNDYL